jgi:hypothetical protein
MSFFAGDFTVILEHGDDSGLSDAVLVTAEETLGSIVFVYADADTTKRIGYIGKKRYVRLSLVSTNIGEGEAAFLGGAILGGAIHQPTVD